MSEPDLSELHSRALDATREIVAGIEAGQWSAPTPCSEWDVRGLVNHVVTGNLWAKELAAGRSIDEVGDRLDGDVLGDDPVAAYDASAAAAEGAFGAAGAMDALCAVSYGPVTGAVYCGHRFIDVLIHGWDLATATGQPTTLDHELVDARLDVVRPQAELLAASGAFDTDVTAADGAGAQVQLLALLGREG